MIRALIRSGRSERQPEGSESFNGRLRLSAGGIYRGYAVSYYANKLSGERLQKCYELAPPRVLRYLEAEIQHVLEFVEPGDDVLELGCGYGRVALRLAEKVGTVVGIDTSVKSLSLARRLAADHSTCTFLQMDAVDLALDASSFDLVVCIQNGISAFGVDQGALVREAMRVTRPGGRVLFSSYSEKFWAHRLEWFESQAGAGLIGPIDYAETGAGTIVCTDGFRAGAMTAFDFHRLCSRTGADAVTQEVDDSSLFCMIRIGEG